MQTNTGKQKQRRKLPDIDKERLKEEARENKRSKQAFNWLIRMAKSKGALVSMEIINNNNDKKN